MKERESIKLVFTTVFTVCTCKKRLHCVRWRANESQRERERESARARARESEEWRGRRR